MKNTPKNTPFGLNLLGALHFITVAWGEEIKEPCEHMGEPMPYYLGGVRCGLIENGDDVIDFTCSPLRCVKIGVHKLEIVSKRGES